MNKETRLRLVIIIILCALAVLFVNYGRNSSHEESLRQDKPIAVESRPCIISVNMATTVYSRPSKDANVFGVLEKGESQTALGRTLDGWIGFDPGVAQAGNEGVNRLRWVAGDSGVDMKGGCDDLTVYAVPDPKAN